MDRSFLPIDMINAIHYAIPIFLNDNTKYKSLQPYIQNLNENSHRKLKLLIENNIHNNYISYTNYINYIDIHRIVIIGFKYLEIYNYKNPEIKIYTNNFSNRRLYCKNR